MRRTADVVVVGGGITGCAIAWHLAERGIADTLLLERAELTAGSTWHAAGGFHSLNGSSAMAALQSYTIGLYDRLQAESEESLGLHRTGAVYVAGDDTWAEFFTVEQARALTAGVMLRDLDAAELREVAPIVDTSRVVHALFDMADGHLDPTGTTRAFAAGARRRGAEIVRHCPVTALTPRPGGGWSVETPNGTVLAKTVVIAAGLWSREVAALAGVELPVLPMEHQYLLTEPILELSSAREVPTIADFSSGSYLRQEGRGLLYGTYEQGPRHWSLDGTPPGFGMDLLPPDLDRLAPNLERAAERIPCLATAGLRRVVNGPLMVSPDGNPVVGPVGPGLFVAAGVLAGFSQCGGIGLALANWIADGEPGMDVWSMDVARFGAWATPAFVHARTRETYERRYTLTKPNEHLGAARPLRTTPLFDRLAAAGAVWGAQAGWEYPTHFAPAGAPPERPSWTRSDAFPLVRGECLAVRDAAGLFEISAYAKLLIEGEGAGAWLQGLTCNALPRRDARVGLMPLVSPSGRLAGDLTATRLGPDRFLLIGSPQAEALYLRLLAPPPGVTVANLTEAWGGLSISGPAAPAILRELGLDLPHLGAALVEVGQARVLALGLSFTGEAGAELYAPAALLRHVHDAVVRAGRPYGLRLIGVSALNSLRLEKLYPSFGSEITADANPFEAGLGRYVREAHAPPALLARRGAGGPRLCGLLVDGGDLDPVGSEPVLDGGTVVGRVSSAAFGHRIGRAVALAFLPPSLAVEGRPLAVRVLGRDLLATVTLRPPYDPEGLRLGAAPARPAMEAAE